MTEYYIGLMSGTSVDGIDAALVCIGEDSVNLVATHSHPYPDAVRERLLHAIRRGGNVRVGFENNHTAPDGAPFRDNAASVAALVAAAAREGFQPRRTS